MRNAPSRALLVGLVAVALVASGVAPVAGAAPSPAPSLDAGASAGDASAVDPLAVDPSAAEQIEEPFDPATSTRILIEPTPDRDARWTVSVRYALTDGADRAAFDAVGDRFVEGEIGPKAALFEGFAREASRNVDRTMRIEDAAREVVVHDDPSSFGVASGETAAVGELRLTFVWTQFLDEDGENLVLGDALTTPNGGTWLLSLEEGQTLEVATPEGYTITGTSDATDRLRDNAVIIEGPRVFGEEERVAVVYAPAASPPWTMITAAIVVAAVLIAGSIVGYRRIDGGPAPASGGSTNGATVDSDGGERAGPEGRDDAEGAAGDPDPTVDGPEAGDDATPEGDDEDLSLLSDEERVERLLEENGGRMRQADIVAETGWSDAKVSQLLSAMADAGRVEKLRLGRENLISVPDSDGAGGDDGRSDSEPGGNGESEN
ncbi:helix-turn-helix transcriptional regulator [Halorubrum sp. FL23]|uniref:helix-turn-helix transcriptional regulator n=1 Tax=Halorubrum sp. FL23 TaxID=3458704 RepID=UPI004033D0D0